MRRVIVPALMAIAMVAASSVNASAFGLFDKLCNKGCDSCCDVEPTCGCEAPACCEPTCAAPAPCCEPACGCEVADPCCDSGCGGRKKGLFSCLFGKRNRGCDSCCEPTCAAPAPCCEPACGCEVIDPCCDSGCCAPKKSCGLKGLFGKLFKKNNCCDSGCCAEPTCCAEPVCGCEAPACCEPTCGYEPSCGACR
jgi:hypothetical protein